MSGLAVLPLLALVAALVGFFAMRFVTRRLHIAAAFAIWFVVIILALLVPYLWHPPVSEAEGFLSGLWSVAISLPLVIGASLGVLLGLRQHFAP